MARAKATGRRTASDAAAHARARQGPPLFEAAPLPLAVVEGPQHVVRAVNPAFCRLIGAAPDAVIGRPVAEVVPQWPGSQALLDRVARTGTAETVGDPPQGRPGAGGWSWTVWPVRGPGTRPVAGVMILGSEPSDADQGRQQLTAINQALVVSSVEQHTLTDTAEALTAQVTAQNVLLETILEQAAEEIVVRDAHGRLLLANAEVRRWLRPVPEGPAALEGTPLERAPALWGALLDADGQPIPLDAYPIGRALRGERVPSLEVQRAAPDGRLRALLTSAAPLVDPQGARVGAVAISIDITPQKHKEAELREARDTLERRVTERTAALFQAVQTLEAQAAQLRALAAAEQRLRTELEERLRFEALLADLSAQFVRVPAEEMDRLIEEAQRRIVQALGLDRSTLLQRAEGQDNLAITHAWARPDVAAHPDLFAKRHFPWVQQTLLKGDIVRFTTLAALPPAAHRDQAAFRAMGQRSLVMFPLTAIGRVFGALSFGTLTAERAWPEELVQRLQLMADIFANALARQRSEQALQGALADVTRLKQQLEAENAYLRQAMQAQPGNLVGTSPALKEAVSQADHVAPTDASVLLLGETGTGKELLAHLIHRRSRRKDRALVTVNCAALPPTLIEAELFGREKGAYTGALTRQAGRFELADGSTIFLDEIAELPVELQVKLLRVLEEGQLERIGSTTTLTVDVRVIAATNRDLAALVAHGKFREDLYYRLNVFPIVVPPLRERGEDIPLLAWTFAKHYGAAIGKPVERISQETMTALRHYPWPGNIRELRNVIERAVILSASSTLQVPMGAAVVPAAAPPPTLAAAERGQILAALDQTGWRIRGPAGTAALLGLKPTTLESRIKKLGLSRPR
jgi:transcriptional regulator with GAF, ATPase, and Fis domain/PAS domain-containing protein